MKKYYSSLLATLLALVTIGIAGCKKEDTLVLPPVESHFANQTEGSYFVRDDPNSVFKIPIGLTAASNVDRKIDISITSPTDAVEGTQYIVEDKIITIPAGKVLDSFAIKGLFDGYPTGRKDTLVITITGGDVTPLESNNTFTLVLQKYCDVVLSDLEGDYNNCFDLQEGSDPYGPYSTFITAGSSSGTKGSILVDNFWDVGGPATEIDLDWTDPSNFITTVPDQYLYTDSRYGEARIRSFGKGTFSSCDQTFLISYEVYLPEINNSFGSFITKLQR